MVDRALYFTGSCILIVLAGCGDGAGMTGGQGASGGASEDGSTVAGGNSATSTSGTTTGGMSSTGAGGSGPCATRISYGDAWIHPPNHPESFDDVVGAVTWDGVCQTDGPSSFASLSNGFKPYFAGHGSCVIALDTTCPAPSSCSTRITYGPSWIAAPNHPSSFDDVPGRVYWNRDCTNQSGGSFATLSNGWAPHFNGNNACDLSFAITDCGGLYQNPVVGVDCPDPGVLNDSGEYVLSCTSGNAANAFPIRTSTDLIHWTAAGSIFPSAAKPTWATGDFWAPEIHHVGNHFVAYFSARHQNGRLSIGAATSNNASGPFSDIGHPLVQDPSLGLIDATEVDDSSGNHYVVWKVDGNAVGQHTPIMGQALSADGTALTGSPVQLITNDEAWEGGVVEGPFIVANGGSYYLFYSGNAYYNGTYAVGVARASSPLGPYQKLGAPILTTDAAWVGPGHCSVVDAPSGDTAMVFHAWQTGHVNGPGDGRMLLVDEVEWENGWPTMIQSPSSHSRSAP